MPLLSYRTGTNGLKKNWCFVHRVHIYIIYLNIYISKQRVQLPDFQFLSPTCNSRHNRAFSVKVGHITCIWNSWPLKIWDWIGMNLYRDYLYKLNGLIAWHYRIYTILQYCTSNPFTLGYNTSTVESESDIGYFIQYSRTYTVVHMYNQINCKSYCT